MLRVHASQWMEWEKNEKEWKRKEWKREYLLIILLFQLHKITVISRPTVTLSNFIVSNYSHELLVLVLQCCISCFTVADLPNYSIGSVYITYTVLTFQSAATSYLKFEIEFTIVEDDPRLRRNVNIKRSILICVNYKSSNIAFGLRNGVILSK